MTDAGAQDGVGVFTIDEDGPSLIGTRCENCATVVFPRQGACPRCTSRDVTVTSLSREGVLWTWTVQTFPPPSPPYRGGDFEPYGVGYVELPEGVRVQARLTESDPDRLKIGAPMRLVLIAEPGAEDAGETFAFAPIEEQA